MKKILFIITVFSGCLPLGITHAITLIEAIQKTVETNPDVLVTTGNRRAVDQELVQARAGYLPSINLVGGYGRENSDNLTTRSRYPEGDVTLNRQEAGVTVSQMLFDGFDVKYNVEHQDARVDAATYQVLNISENTGLRVVETYLEVLRRQELLELAKDNLIIHQKTLQQIRAVAEGGAGQRADVQQSESRLALATSNMIRAQGNLREAEANYQRVIGEVPAALTHVQRELVEKALDLPTSLGKALELATTTHPNLKGAMADLQAAQAQHRQTGASFLPHFDLELGASKNKNLDGVDGANDDLSAMVRMRYNLYRGGADKARRREAAERVSAAQESVQRTQRLVEEEVRVSWNALMTMRERLVPLQKYVAASEQVVTAYKEQFKLGRRSLLDMLDSENELFEARSALVIGRYTELFGMFRLAASLGLMLDKLGIKRPQESVLSKE